MEHDNVKSLDLSEEYSITDTTELCEKKRTTKIDFMITMLTMFFNRQHYQSF